MKATCEGKTAARWVAVGLVLAGCAPIPNTGQTTAQGEAAIPTTFPPETQVPAPTRSAAAVRDCGMFPPDHIWNARVDDLPLHPNSRDYGEAIGADIGMHPDFGSGLWDGGPIGIPYAIVDAATPRSPVSFLYADESDPGPYPIPASPPIEGGPDSDGDRHILMWDPQECRLYELYDAHAQGAGWEAGSGAIFDLSGYALRPEGWTSADAAGLPILPGLVRYDEVEAGAIRHALRFTAPDTRHEYVWPARHQASDSEDPALPAMGERFRLRADFELSGFSPEVQVILEALQSYGMMLADNGSAWYLSGAPDERWDNEALHELDSVRGSDFEAVDVMSLQVDPDSGATR